MTNKNIWNLPFESRSHPYISDIFQKYLNQVHFVMKYLKEIKKNLKMKSVPSQ